MLRRLMLRLNIFSETFFYAQVKTSHSDWPQARNPPPSSSITLAQCVLADITTQHMKTSKMRWPHNHGCTPSKVRHRVTSTSRLGSHWGFDGWEMRMASSQQPWHVTSRWSRE